MARKLKERIKVQGQLMLESPLHVGGMSLDPTVDLSLAVDGRGRYYIPGTSLAGALRAWMNLQFDEDLTRSLWGYQKGDLGHASHVVIEDSFFKATPIEIRDGVAIDREWGSAAELMKYDRAILPKGAQCEFKLMVEVPEQQGGGQASERFSEALEALLNALCAGDIRLGAAKSRGLGKVKLSDCYRTTQVMDSRVGVLDLLKGIAKPELAGEQVFIPNLEAVNRVPRIRVTVNWHPVGPLMVKDAQEGIAVDILPLVSGEGPKLAFVLPGSSIKGALRTHAERIIRTVCQINYPGLAQGRERFMRQIDVPLVNALFGTPATSGKTEKTEGPQPGLSALLVEDCYGASFTTQQWQKVLQAKTELQLREALVAAGLHETQQAFHVAVDRWTGGAAPNMLYSNLEPFGSHWGTIELDVQLSRLQAQERGAAVALFVLLLREFAQSRIPLGYGVNRGLGAVAVDDISLNAQGLDIGAISSLDTTMTFDPTGNLELTQGSDLLNVMQTLEQDWQEWIGKIKKMGDQL